MLQYKEDSEEQIANFNLMEEHGGAHQAGPGGAHEDSPQFRARKPKPETILVQRVTRANTMQQ